MRIPRIYQPSPLSSGLLLTLSSQATNHVARVLRFVVGDHIKIFNGEGGEYLAKIIIVSKREVVVEIENFISSEMESPFKIHLGQGISKGEKMDFVIQKTTELGVNEITPLMSKRCDVKLNAERWEKRLEHWRAVAMSACEQCGRDKLPLINHPQSFQSWIVQPHPGMKIIFHPEGTQKLDRFSKENLQGNLLIGPEGGFDEAEIDLAKQNGFNIVGLGPRILRTETAAVSALTVLQFQFGDMKDRG